MIYRITFASEPSLERFPTSDAGSGGGGAVSGRGENAVAALDPFVYQDLRWCERCAGEQNFIAVFEFELGRLGYCAGCGEEKVQRFTRSIGEAA